MSAPTVSRGARAGAVALLAALLAGCGSSSKGLIPTANAGLLQQDFANVEQFVASGDCAHALGWIHQANIHLAALPPTVNAGLKAQLQAGIADLTVSAARECAQNATATTSTTSATSTTSIVSTSTSATSSSPTTTSSAVVTTSASSPTPPVTTGNNGGTGFSSSSTATGGGNAAPGGGGGGNGNGQGGNGQGNGQGNGAGGVGAP